MREKLVDPAQFDRKKKAKKLGDPKRPPLASAALLEFMGPGHSSDELRLPPPPSPFGQGTAELTPFPDRAFTRTVVERGGDGSRKALDSALARVNAAPDKLERMRAVIHREAQMLSLLGKVQADTDEVIERMKQEYKANGSY
ncbi:MAG TPA: hypothetical protein VGK67_39260 [Myxococcales bacterium]